MKMKMCIMRADINANKTIQTVINSNSSDACVRVRIINNIKRCHAATSKSLSLWFTLVIVNECTPNIYFSKLNSRKLLPLKCINKLVV